MPPVIGSTKIKEQGPFWFDQTGINFVSSWKIDAYRQPTPTNLHQLVTFLGVLR
jgi:hypothetical protein